MTIRTASQILDEIRSMRGLKSDAQLGKLLGNISQATIGSWRARNSIPFKKIVAFCHREGQSLDTLVLGDLIPKEIPVNKLYLPETVALMPEIDRSLRQMEPLERYAFITSLMNHLKTCAAHACAPNAPQNGRTEQT
jgi:Bacteriophage CI repressor helix-turn-helix domain